MDRIQHRSLSLLQGSDSFANDARVAHLEQRAVANGITPVRIQHKNGRPARSIGFDEPQKGGVDLLAI